MKRIRPLAAPLLLAGCAPGPIIDYAPPDSLLRTLSENLFTTHYSALVNVEDSRVIDDAAALTGESDLAAIAYSATVLETYRGEERAELEYLHFVDPDDRLEGHTRGEVIVSLCRERGGEYFYLPDVGYEIPAQPVLIERARVVSSRLSSAGAEATEGHACR